MTMRLIIISLLSCLIGWTPAAGAASRIDEITQSAAPGSMPNSLLASRGPQCAQFLGPEQYLVNFQGRNLGRHKLQAVEDGMRVLLANFGKNDRRAVFRGLRNGGSAEVIVPRIDSGDFSVAFTTGTESLDGIRDSLAPLQTAVRIESVGKLGLPIPGETILVGANFSSRGMTTRAEVNGDIDNSALAFSGTEELRLSVTQRGRDLIFVVTHDLEAPREYHRARIPRSQASRDRQIVVVSSNGLSGEDIYVDDVIAEGNVNGKAERPVIDEIESARLLQAGAQTALLADPPLEKEARKLLRRAIRRIGAAIRLIRRGGNRGDFQPTTEHEGAEVKLQAAREIDREAIGLIATDPKAAADLVLDANVEKNFARFGMHGYPLLVTAETTRLACLDNGAG